MEPHRFPCAVFEKYPGIHMLEHTERNRMTRTPLSFVQRLAIAQIRLDGGTQSRLALNEEYINELVQAVSEGETLPPVIIYADGSAYWLADGFHRYHALKRSAQETIASELRPGTRRDAVLYAVGANAQHGLRRTNADKRRAVETLLQDSEWARWSDREIARRCGVSHDFVNRLRATLCHSMTDTERLVQRNGTIYPLHAANSGRAQSQENVSMASQMLSPQALFPHTLQVQESLNLRVPPWKPGPEREQPGEMSVPHPAFSEKEEQEDEWFGMKKDEDELEATEADRVPTARYLRFPQNTENDFYREASAPEKERRDAHVLRVMGSSESPEWYTPQEIVHLTAALLGEIDLDPCSNSHEVPAVPARVRYTKEENGLALPWKGKTYLNPPYGSEIPLWVQKLINSYETGAVEEAIALLPGRIDTVWFQPLYAYLICHIQGRLQFANSPYHAPFPCVIVYLGTRSDAFIDIFKCKGPILRRIG